MPTEFKVTMTLSEEKLHMLIMGLGAAVSLAFAEGKRGLAYSLVRLSNEVNKDNPNWTPYVIPEEFDSHDHSEEHSNHQDEPRPRGHRPAGKPRLQ